MLFILPRLRPRQRVAAVMVTALLAVAVVQLPGAAALVTQRTDVALSSGGSGRVDIWSVGMVIFGAAPVAGVGFANFPVAFTTDRILASAATADPGTSRAPHSIIIGTLGELGLVGFILLALFILPLLARRGWGPEAAVVQAALASLMTAALFLDVLSNRKQVWLLLGIAAGLAYVRRHRGVSRTQHPGIPAGTTGRDRIPGCSSIKSRLTTYRTGIRSRSEDCLTGALRMAPGHPWERGSSGGPCPERRAQR